LDDKKLQPVKVVGYKGDRATLILKEGVNRQIRRMAQRRDNEVVSLKRVRIDKLKLGNLPEGEVREIKPNDVI
jgi:23S rRNA pseudouridine2604 synthase